MKILHSGDWHIGELTGPVVDGQNARLMDTIQCIDHLIETAKQEQPDVIVIPGDLFDKSKLWSDTMLYLIDIAAKKLRQCAGVAPTVLLFGTENHDNPMAFKNIRSMGIPNLYVITKPQIFTIQTNSGPLQIAGVPGLDKGNFRTLNPGMDPSEENQVCSKLLGDVVLGLGAQVNPEMPSIMLAHYSIAGCELDNGQQHIFTQNEVILPREALTVSPFDLVCLGHIHRAQEVPHCDRPVFYSGSLNGLTFNEEGQEKGFWIHDINNKKHAGFCYQHISRFIKTPAREFLTMEVDFTDSVDLQFDMKWKLAGIGPDMANTLLTFPTVSKIVRLHFRCTDDQAKQLSLKEMEKLLLTGGAFYVSEIKRIKDVDYLSKQELSENTGPMESLRTWCRVNGLAPEE
ncbi:MAG: exonuclease subunit SbcD, partial [Firmicutes bacterium]|nr:exonuclease subunit SbcD [Bacillota bacterium]